MADEDVSTGYTPAAFHDAVDRLTRQTRTSPRGTDMWGG